MSPISDSWVHIVITLSVQMSVCLSQIWFPRVSQQPVKEFQPNFTQAVTLITVSNVMSHQRTNAPSLKKYFPVLSSKKVSIAVLR